MTDIHIHLDGGKEKGSVKVAEKKKVGKRKVKKQLFSGPAGFGERAATKMFGW